MLYCGKKHPGEAIDAKPPSETMKFCLYPILMFCYGKKHPGEAIDAKPPISETVEVLH